MERRTSPACDYRPCPRRRAVLCAAIYCRVESAHSPPIKTKQNKILQIKTKISKTKQIFSNPNIINQNPNIINSKQNTFILKNKTKQNKTKQNFFKSVKPYAGRSLTDRYT